MSRNRLTTSMTLILIAAGMGWPLASRAEQGPSPGGESTVVLGERNFDLRRQMRESAELAPPSAPRLGLAAEQIPPAALRAAAALAALPGEDHAPGFHVEWGPRDLPRALLNFEVPLTAPDRRAPEAISRDLLRTNRELFLLSAAEVEGLVVEKSYTTARTGARHLVLMQAVDGIPVYQGRLSFHYDRQGRLVLMHTGDVVPGLAFDTEETLDEVAALTAAIRSLDLAPPQAPVVIRPRASKADTAILQNPFGGEVGLRLMIFPVGGAGRLAWWMQLDLHNGSEWYETLVDAHTGELLYRNNLYAYEAHGRVFADNPERTPVREYRVFPAEWLDGSGETVGNNVDAYEDLTGTDSGDRTASPDPSPDEDFDFEWGDGLTNQDPRDFADAAVTNLFYFVNLYHDYTYELGFDEAAGNFQEDNFGLGGVGGDRVLAEAQDLNSNDNAYFATAVDGDKPKMMMGLARRGTLSDPTDDLDRSVNGDTAFHEHTHGLSNRLVGGPTTTSCLPWWPYEQGGAMGEGWGDFMAINFFDDPVYGEYHSQDLVNGLRGAAYDNQPRTYADLTFGAHSDGEVWGATLWDLREALATALGEEDGHRMAAQLVVDGMKLTPCHPSFIDGRNAILMADQLRNDGANKCLIWQVFADRGMGVAAEGDSTFLHDTDFNTTPACETPRDPVDIVLVLDHSGSMDDPAPGGTQDKIDLLKDAVELFVRGWTPYAVEDDQIGVVFFESAVTQLDDPLLIEFLGSEEDVIGAVSDLDPESYTAMGGGLQKAVEALVASPNDRKHVILFTDGMQNCSPMVRELPADGILPEPNHDIRDEPIGNWDNGVWCDSGLAGAAGTSLESYLTDHNIRFHTIGTGVSGVAWQELLANIAGETEAEHHFTDEPDLDLFRFYEENLVTALAGNTLELVGYETDTLSTEVPERVKTFTINASVKRATFILSWRNPAPETPLNLGFYLTSPSPGEEHITAKQAQATFGDHYQIYTLDFPHYRNLAGHPRKWIDHRGVWKMVISGSSLPGDGVVFDASLLVDETRLHYDFRADRKDYDTGEAILLSARVTEGQTPVRTLSRAQVTVERPRLGAGTFLATTTVREDRERSSPVQDDRFRSLVEKKTYLLMQDAEQRARLKPLEEVVSLRDDGQTGDARAGDGVYSALLTDTAVPGVYGLKFDVAGKTLRSGKFSRAQWDFVQVRLKTPSLETTDLTAVIVERPSDGDDDGGDYVVEISVTPRDRFDNYLGPGHRLEIDISAAAGTFDGPVKDRLDGSYSRRLRLTDLAADPRVTVTVRDTAVYDDPLSEVLVSARRTSFSLHGGWAFPRGAFGRSHDPGPSLTLDAEYRFKPRFAFVGLVGYHAFPAATANADDTFWINVSANLRHDWSAGAWRPFVGGGIGLYIPEHGSSELGINASVGAGHAMSPGWTLELGADYHRVFTAGDDIEFVVSRIGAVFHF